MLNRSPIRGVSAFSCAGEANKVVNHLAGKSLVVDWGSGPYLSYPERGGHTIYLSRGFKILKRSLGIIWVLETTYDIVRDSLNMKYRVYCKPVQNSSVTSDLLTLDDTRVPWEWSPQKARVTCYREFQQYKFPDPKDSRNRHRHVDGFLNTNAALNDYRELFAYRSVTVQDKLKNLFDGTEVRVRGPCYTLGMVRPVPVEASVPEEVPVVAHRTPIHKLPLAMQSLKRLCSDLIAKTDEEMERCAKRSLIGLDPEAIVAYYGHMMYLVTRKSVAVDERERMRDDVVM